MLGDITVAEPGALISFTGPRVVQQTTREKLPDDFGLAESNLRFGHLDAIVPRVASCAPTSARVAAALRAMPGEAERRLRERLSQAPATSRCSAARTSRGELQRLAEAARADLEAEPTGDEIWRSVELARHRTGRTRSTTSRGSLDDWVELHGDRGAGRRRCDGRRARAARRPDGRPRRAAEGPRHPGADQAPVRHAVPGGLPQGDAGDGARRPPRVPGDQPRRHAGRLPGRRRRAARAGRRDRRRRRR